MTAVNLGLVSYGRVLIVVQALQLTAPQDRQPGPTLGVEPMLGDPVQLAQRRASTVATVDFYENIIQMPAPVGQGVHLVAPSSQYLGREHGTKPVPTGAHSPVADLDATFGLEIVDGAQ